jgi:CRP/FNR family transcriptional regulator, dissimilatory nitrate respiration regulator
MFFRGLDDAAMTRLVSMAGIRRFRKGQIIFRQEDPCPGIYVVGTGVVKIFKISPNGKEHVLHFASAGMTFAEVAAIGRFACPASAEVLEPCTCALLPQESFTRLLETSHKLCLQLMVSMAGWVRHLVGLMEDIVLRDATARVAQHLLVQERAGAERKDFSLPMRKKDLASHLNLTSETLSRTFARLAACGLIQMGARQRIRILDRQSLADIAQGLLPEEFG